MIDHFPFLSFKTFIFTISSLLKSDKESIQNVLNNLSTYSQQEIKAIAIMLENTKVVPGNLAKKDLTDYIKFYASQMNNLSYKLYKKDNLVKSIIV